MISFRLTEYRTLRKIAFCRCTDLPGNEKKIELFIMLQILFKNLRISLWTSDEFPSRSPSVDAKHNGRSCYILCRYGIINLFCGKTTRATGFGNNYIIKVIDHAVSAASRRWNIAINFVVRLYLKWNVPRIRPLAKREVHWSGAIIKSTISGRSGWGHSCFQFR